MKIKIILILFIYLELKFIICNHCGSNEMKITPYVLDIGDIQRRKLTNEYSGIDIKVDMTYLKSQNIISDEKIKDLEEIFEEVTGYFQKILSVQKMILNVDFYSIKEYCQITKFDLGNNDFDVLIFPYISDNLSANVLAGGTPCLIANTYRPIAGVIEINKNLSWEKKDFKYYMKTLLFHELSHVLAFHPEIFKGLNLIFTKNIDGEKYYYINSPKVLEKAKLHFGCNDIQGVQLENDGGTGTVGSHWDSRYMLSDYMMAYDYIDVVISDISLALFEDTGFYKANYYTGGLFRFGKNQGCSFIEKKCLYNNGANVMFPNDFCNVRNEPFCTSSHISKGKCYITQNLSIKEKFSYFGDKKTGGLYYADYCPVSYQTTIDNNYFFPNNCRNGKTENEGEIIGEDSLCFESSINNSEMKSTCYKIECDSDDKKINVYIGNKIITCPGEETVLYNINGLNGQIKCPNYNLVCTSKVWCNDIFECIDKSSEADLSTYDYISNMEVLLKRDNENLLIDDSISIIEENNNNISLKLNNIMLLLLLLINF